MSETGEIVVVRLGHRPGRDDRITTHVGLTARALGADRFVLIGDHADPIERIDDVTERFGGPFETQVGGSFRSFANGWDGRIAHLTMYGMPIQNVIGEVEYGEDSDGIALVVGAEKVPFEVYEAADWNVAVTNQPHSEVAGVAIFLRELLGPAAFATTFEGGTHRIEPKPHGKQLTPRDGR